MLVVYITINNMGTKTIYNRFHQWVALQPKATAVAEDGRPATYQELDAMANAIMAKFYNKQYSTIGLVMSHSIEIIAAMIAVIKSGAAYVLWGTKRSVQRSVTR